MSTRETMAAHEEMIEIRKLRKQFWVEGKPLVVLEDFSLSIPRRAITVVLGKSGCGKTTLLRMLGGLDRDYDGEILYPQNAKTAFVFQEPRLMPWLKVRDNITFGLKRGEIDREEIQRLISLAGLTGFEQVYPRQLSGGMSQRVALARALALKPQYLLMDEPFAALDYFTRSSMQEALLDIHRQHDCGVLFVTHSIDEAIRLGDHIVIIDQKRVKKVYHLRGKQVLTETPVGCDRSGERAAVRDLADLKEDILQNINS